MPRPNLRGRSPLAVLFLTVFLDLVGFGIIIPILQLHAKALDASELEIALLFTVYSGMQLVFGPIWGRLSDSRGRRPVLLISVFGSFLSQLGYALAPTFTLLVVARAVAGICGANISAAQAYIADVTDEKSRAAGMGALGAAFGLGFVIGPAMGGLLAHYGDRVPFFAAAALSLLNFVLAIFLLPEPKSRAERAPSAALTWDRVARTLAAPRLRGLIVLFFVITFGFTALEATFPLFLHARLEYTPARIGLAFTAIGVIMVLVQGLLLRRLAAAFGERRLIIAGTALMSVGLVAQGMVTGTWSLALALVLVATGSGLNTPSLSSLISREAGPERQGVVLGVAQSAGALARIVGPPFGLGLFARGHSLPYFAAALVIGGACVAAALFVRPAGERVMPQREAEPEVEPEPARDALG